MMVRQGRALRRARLLWLAGERDSLRPVLVVGGFRVEPPAADLTLLDASEDQRDELEDAGYRLAPA